MNLPPRDALKVTELPSNGPKGNRAPSNAPNKHDCARIQNIDTCDLADTQMRRRALVDWPTNEAIDPARSWVPEEEDNELSDG